MLPGPKTPGTPGTPETPETPETPDGPGGGGNALSGGRRPSRCPPGSSIAPRLTGCRRTSTSLGTTVTPFGTPWLP